METPAHHAPLDTLELLVPHVLLDTLTTQEHVSYVLISVHVVVSAPQIPHAYYAALDTLEPAVNRASPVSIITVIPVLPALE